MRYFIFILFAAGPMLVNAQGKDTTASKTIIDSINRLLDVAVVEKNRAVMERHYAQDFFFTHGTGALDSKTSWVEYVMRPDHQYLSRTHDSTQIELHGDVALATGTLTVKRKDAAYGLRYSRLYAWRQKRWQLLSHRTFREWHF